MTTIDKTDARLSTHEEVCALRYKQINARLKRIETIMLAKEFWTTEDLTPLRTASA